MPHYMIQFAYSHESVKAMVAKPQDRRAMVEKLINSGGGTLECMYFAFGEFDGVAIGEFPSNVDVAATMLTVGASGGFTALRTTVLITPEEAVSAMEGAKKLAAAYTAPRDA